MSTDDAMLLDLEYKLTVGMLLSSDDVVCAEYFVNQRERLLPAILAAAIEQGRDVDHVFAAFARGVHQRHESGADLLAYARRGPVVGVHNKEAQ